MNDRQLKLEFVFEENKDTSASEFNLDLSYHDLFGLEDAGHEDLDLLTDYSIFRSDLSSYLNMNLPYKILCAPKGTGKTTLCRLWQSQLEKRQNVISVLRFDSQISPQLNNKSLPQWIRAWKTQIVKAILAQIFDDEIKGIYEVLRILEGKDNRTTKKISFVAVLLEIIDSWNISRISSEQFLQKDQFEKLKTVKDYSIWIFLDEIDQYFTRERDSILKMASMLSAARELTSHFSNVFIRTTIKPNVWSILLCSVESMSNLRELIVPLTWKLDDIRAM